MTAGCGGGGSSTAGNTAAGDSAGGSPATGGERRAIHEPIQSRGIKGEDPSTEAATRARISAAGCAALARIAEGQLAAGGSRGGGEIGGDGVGRRSPSLSTHSDPSPPLSRCRLFGHGVSINVYLDSGFAAHQRYDNRIEETVQFGYEDPAKVPHSVPRVGEKAAYNADANWIPALRSLLAVRGNRWLTVTISVAGHSNEELRDQAAVLARAGFKLTVGG